MSAEITVRKTNNGREIDPVRDIVRHGPWRANQVRRKRGDAMHHNGFDVAAIAVGLTADGRVVEAAAANQNLRPGSNPSKECAEQRAVRALRTKGIKNVFGLYVSGPPQPDTQSGLHTPILHSCGQCRDFLGEAPETKGDLIVVHFDPYIDAHEIYSLDELVAMHEEPTDELNYVVDPGFRGWRQSSKPQINHSGELHDLTMASPAERVRQAVTGRLAGIDWQRVA